VDVSAVWCHWCHVMDQTTYADPSVAELIDRYYVAVRVDNDRRPDINERYNMGGWPTTAFLTPDGDVLTGATYVPPEQMRRLLAQVADYYTRNRQQIRSNGMATRQQPGAPQPAGDAAELQPDIVATVLESVRDNFDREFGGFGSQPKFSPP